MKIFIFLVLFSTKLLACEIPLTLNEWKVEYNGYGYVVFDQWGIIAAPKSVNKPTDTSAFLILSKRYLEAPIKDFRLTVKATTRQQLRTGTPPNAWEVFWVMFNYQGGATTKTTNYLTVKPNGMEIGKASATIAQEFLYTSSTPALPIGKETVWVITKRGQSLEMLVDGKSYFFLGSGSKLLYDTAGTIGLYAEDAKVRISSVSVEAI